MWTAENCPDTRFDNEELELQILLSWRSLIFIDGPSWCGKTYFLRHMESDGVFIMPFVDFQYENWLRIRKNTPIDVFCRDIRRRFPCDLFVLEDIDIRLSPNPTYQYETARVLLYLAQMKKIILTGIKLEKRCPILFSELGKESYQFFHYIRA